MSPSTEVKKVGSGGWLTSAIGRAPADWLPFLIMAAYAVLSIGFAAAAGFRQSHNDYWDVFFVARHLELGDARSWFNPQYPIGSILTLRALASFSRDPAAPAILFNIAVSAAVLGLSARFYKRFLSPAFAGIAVFFLAVFFEFFRYSNAGGGDPASVLCFAAGGMLALATLSGDPGRDAIRRMVAAGWLLGAAALYRYHALPASVLFGAALLLAWPRRFRSVIALGLGAAGAYSLQWGVNLAAGRGLMETQFGPMNVYDLMHGVNWRRITSLNLDVTVSQIIAEDPALFFRKYLTAFWSFKMTWGPPLLAFVLVRDPVRRRVFFALSAWILVYFLLFSATTSGRQALIPLPFSMLALGAVAQAVWERRGQTSVAKGSASNLIRRIALVLILAAMTTLHLTRDLGWLEQRALLHASSSAVENRLQQEGVLRATEVFTTDFDLYFQKLEGVIPFFNGGAPRLGTYGYNETFPEFPVDDLEAFRAACRTRGVRYVVLDASARHLSESLGRLYSDIASESSAGFALIDDTLRYRVYRVR